MDENQLLERGTGGKGGMAEDSPAVDVIDGSVEGMNGHYPGKYQVTATGMDLSLESRKKKTPPGESTEEDEVDDDTDEDRPNVLRLVSSQESTEDDEATEEDDFKAPPPQEQSRIIKDLLKQKLHVGDNWFLISSKWWNRWRYYTEETELESHWRPQSIDNSNLLRFDKELRSGLVEHVDYHLVPESAWDQLIEWYGGGPSISRTLR
eukprot:TRINITY_DN12844_c0_g1_i1.p1 TRINITY_DN12844_c0_g1~~TRINITY_DN12844_c0_g1_i1.p1  ORF type:complete len:207 (+),score=31.94 TRINITY_DN12844_c0_g1_i1:39-659(+)